MSVKYQDLPGWTFEVDEVSAGVYKVVGSDSDGHTVEKTGTGPDELLEQCKVWAYELINKGAQNS